MMKPIRIAAMLLTPALFLSCKSPEGVEVFKRENCTKCHLYDDVGMGVIDISDVAERRSSIWLKDHIRNPRIHNSTSGMPGFGHLSGKEIDALVGFLEKGP